MANKVRRKTLKDSTVKQKKVLPLLLYPAQDKTEEAWLTQLRKNKKIHKIGPRLYASVAKAEVVGVVRAQWAQIVSRLYPTALLSHRSALEYKPSADHEITLTGTTNRSVSYAGLTLRFVRGPARLEDDSSFLGIHVSSQARAFLENLSTTKATVMRSLSRVELETRLEAILKAKGELALNQIRDRAREIATDFDWQREFKKFDQMIGALLGTRPETVLTTATGRARARGRAYDSERVARLDLLFGELRATPLKQHRDQFVAKDHFNNKAFFEAYFSNYIEGTTFEIEEAEEIIFDNKIPEDRPKDAHDILGTFQIVSDPNEMKKTPSSASELEDLIRSRHAILMAERPEANPGKYKNRPNRAGDTQFVRPDEVEGTLEKGFERYRDLPKGLARAIFIMFLIAEVHPFTDGNGRIARIMMNAELFSNEFSTLIIPTVYREDYLLALRTLTRRNRPDPLIRMLVRVHQFSYLEFSPYPRILQDLKKNNWFREPAEAKLIV